jgi:hypothetical protein
MLQDTVVVPAAAVSAPASAKTWHTLDGIPSNRLAAWVTVRCSQPDGTYAAHQQKASAAPRLHGLNRIGTSPLT